MLSSKGWITELEQYFMQTHMYTISKIHWGLNPLLNPRPFRVRHWAYPEGAGTALKFLLMHSGVVF